MIFDIKPGTYMRYDGEIGKVVEFYLDETDKYCANPYVLKLDYFDGYKLAMSEKEVKDLLYSNDITKLLQIHDIVHLEDKTSQELVHIYNEEVLNSVKQKLADGAKLKAILTKEAFDKNKYIVEEKGKKANEQMQ